MLEQVVAPAVITAAGDGLIDQIPSLDLSSAGIHHTLDPFIHGIDKGVVHLLLSLGNHPGRSVALELDALYIDFAYVVRHMQQQETALHGWLDADFHILPLICERERDIGTATPVTEAAIQFA